MKRKYFFQFIHAAACIGTLMLAVSCEESLPADSLSLESAETSVKHKVQNTIHIEDVMNLFGGLDIKTRSSMNIDCISDESGDTLLYVTSINFYVSIYNKI